MRGCLVYEARFPKTQQPSTKRPNPVAKRAKPCTQQSVAVASPKKKRAPK